MPAPSICFVNYTPIFYPVMQVIDAISNSNPMTVTTSRPHGYIVGMIVRLDIPIICGMQQADGLYGTILSIGAGPTPTTFTLDIDSTFFDVFAIPAPGPDPLNPYSNQFPCAQVVPAGEVNTIITAAVQNVLP